MDVRVRNAPAAEGNERKASEAVFGRVKMRMLAREDDPGADAPFGERSGEWSELDGFRTRSDDQRDAIVVQPSP